MPETNLHAVESGRAAHAYQTVQLGMLEAKKLDAKADDKYANSCTKLPTLIRVNGLVPALLLAEEKGTNTNSKQKQYGNLSRRVMKWLIAEECPVNTMLDPVKSSAEGVEQIAKLVSLHSTAYRPITAEVLNYLRWASRFARALKPDAHKQHIDEAED